MKFLMILAIILVVFYILTWFKITFFVLFDGGEFKLAVKYLGRKTFLKLGKGKQSKSRAKKFNVKTFEKIVVGMDRKIDMLKDALYKVLRKFSKCIRIRKLNFIVTFGTGDPATAGVLSGLCWSVFGSVFSIVNSNIQIDSHKIDFRPDFYNEKFNLEFDSIIETRPVHIISMILTALRSLLPLWKQIGF